MLLVTVHILIKKNRPKIHTHLVGFMPSATIDQTFNVSFSWTTGGPDLIG